MAARFTERCPIAPRTSASACAEKRRDPFLEIVAAVAPRDEIVGLGDLARAGRPECLAPSSSSRESSAAHVRVNVSASVRTVSIDRVGRHDPRDEAERQRFVGVDEPAGEQQILRPRRADEIDQALSNWRPTGNCRASARSARRIARPACRRAGRTRARSRSRRRSPRPAPARSSASHALEPIEHRVEPPLVGEGVLAGRELRKLADVGARDERLAAGALEHEHADRPRRRPRGRTPRRAPRTSPRSSRCAPRDG